MTTTTTITPQQRIEAEVKAALKAGDKSRLQTLRLLLTDLKNERIRRGAEVDEAGFVGLVRKAIKQREEAATQYRTGQRPELAAKEDEEAATLATFLPPAVGEDDLRAAIAALIAERNLAGPAAMGPIMKEMIARYGANADSSTINRLAREQLANAGGAR